MKSIANSFNGSRMANGGLCFSLPELYADMAMSVGINHSRSVSTSYSYTMCVYCMSHHIFSNRNVCGNIPSAASLEKATIFPSQLDRFKKERARRLIPQRTYMCPVG